MNYFLALEGRQTYDMATDLAEPNYSVAASEVGESNPRDLTAMGGSAETLNEKRDGVDAIANDPDFKAVEEGDQVPIEKPKEQQANGQDPFLVLWEGHGDPGCPKGMKKRTKWIITLIVAAGAFNTTCASSIYTSTYSQIEKEFGSSHELAIAGLSLFVMGLGVGPMFLAPLSEFYGRRGTVGDMFEGSDLGLPMMVYTASPFIGPEVGPLIGGFINENTNWRWTCTVFGMGTLLVYSAVFAFLVDCYPLYAASAMAANSFSRSCFAAGFPLFSTQMYQTLGAQYATLILALLTVVMAPFPFLFFKYGEQLRKHSRYAKSP
ncbi:hypothetical protein TWF788_005474 [Orbilia oligospora]|uniref:Major facilitator superfamily (MFS) profile domain-containing protein n=1 Tax=Orbilia oligospora TaxID=2813651 RepID=A0A7C8K8G4_ORBOL|nr:hypothetical protein TWF788_005474 [Orbilia oligospora]